MLCFDFVAQSHTPPRRAAAAAAPQPPPRRPPQPRHQADCGYRAIRGRRKGAVRLGNGNESDSSAPTIRLATLIRGARTAAGGERARILGAGASTAASTPVEILGSARGRHLICARAHLLRRAPRLATTWPSLQTVTPDSIEEPPHRSRPETRRSSRPDSAAQWKTQQPAQWKTQQPAAARRRPVEHHPGPEGAHPAMIPHPLFACSRGCRH